MSILKTLDKCDGCGEYNEDLVKGLCVKCVSIIEIDTEGKENWEDYLREMEQMCLPLDDRNVYNQPECPPGCNCRYCYIPESDYDFC